MAAQKSKEVSAERKRANFVKLAQARTNAALDAIGKLGQLANPASYEYSDEDVDKMESAISAKLEESVEALRARKTASKSAFSL